jgi:hypothetical protein
MLAAGTAALLATGAISARADHARHGTASALKGSSCAHPYEVHLGKPRLSQFETLMGDTSYITRKYKALPRPDNNIAPSRRSYSWRALHGTHICEFRIWVTDAYRVGQTYRYKKPVTIEKPLDSHNPRGGRNVVVFFKPHCGVPQCEPREGRVENHEVLTAARG